jgi:chromosome segregation ATPase
MSTLSPEEDVALKKKVEYARNYRKKEETLRAERIRDGRGDSTDFWNTVCETTADTFAKFEKANSVLEKQNAALKAEKDKQIAEKDEQISALEAEIAGLKAENAALEAAKAGLKAENAALEEDNSAIKADFDFAETCVNRMMAEKKVY